MSPRISSTATAPRSAGLTHPRPHDDHVQSRSIREELRNRRKMPTRHFSPKTLIAGGGPRVRTRAGRGCRSHGLRTVSVAARWWAAKGGELRTSALDVADDGTGLVVHELDTALGDTTTGACMAVSLRFLRSPSILSRAAVWLSSIFFLHALPECGDRVPVRPRTRVTLTSLTGALAVSIL